MEVQTRKGIDQGGPSGEPFGQLREMRGDVHKDSPEVGERSFNKNQLIEFKDYLLGRQDLNPTMRAPFEEVLRECLEEATEVAEKPLTPSKSE